MFGLSWYGGNNQSMVWRMYVPRHEVAYSLALSR